MSFWNQPSLIREPRRIRGNSDKMLIVVDEPHQINAFVINKITEKASLVFVVVFFCSTHLILYVMGYDRKSHDLAVRVRH